MAYFNIILKRRKYHGKKVLEPGTVMIAFVHPDGKLRMKGNPNAVLVDGDWEPVIPDYVSEFPWPEQEYE